MRRRREGAKSVDAGKTEDERNKEKSEEREKITRNNQEYKRNLKKIERWSEKRRKRRGQRRGPNTRGREDSEKQKKGRSHTGARVVSKLVSKYCSRKLVSAAQLAWLSG